MCCTKLKGAVLAFVSWHFKGGPGWHSQYGNLLQAGWSGNRILLGWGCPCPSRLTLGPPSHQWVPGFFLGGQIKSKAIPLPPLWAFMGCYKVQFTFTLQNPVVTLWTESLNIVQVNLGVFKEWCIELFLKQKEVLKICTNLLVIMGRKVAYEMKYMMQTCTTIVIDPFVYLLVLVCSPEKLIFFSRLLKTEWG